MKYKFPNKFLWGSATSAAQTEDGNLAGWRGQNIWDHWYKEDPNKFFDGSYVVNDFFKNWKEDLDRAKELNFNSIRLGISMSRIFPKNIQNINQKGVSFYHKVYDYAKKLGLTVIVNLYHFDMPMWLQKKGGWEFKGIAEIFGKYASFVGKEFKQVDMFVTMNEPIVPIRGGYWNQWHYPAKKDFKAGVAGMMNTISSHLHMVKALKESKTTAKIGVVISVEPAIPASQSEEDLEAAWIWDLFEWRTMADAMLIGKPPTDLQFFADKCDMWPEGYDAQDDKELFDDENVRPDFLGVNYYRPSRVQAIEEGIEISNELPPEEMFYRVHAPKGIRMNPYRGWEIHPESIYEILKTVQTKYGNIPTYISENGMGVEDENRYRDENGVIQDHYREEFIAEHLVWVHKAIEEGANVFGYHMWTYIDNWSWLNAYKNRYGFIELNVETGERKEKASADWIRNVIKTNSVDWED